MFKKLPDLPVFAFPILLTIGILIIPLVTDYSNHELAEQVAAQSTRWFWGHIIAAIAFSISVLAACSVITRVVEGGSGSIGRLALFFTAIGAGLHAAGMGADGIGPLATVAGGGEAWQFFEGSGKWITGVFIAAAVTFGIGLILQVVSAIRARLLNGKTRWIVFIASIVFVVAEAIPSGWGLYIVAAVSLVIYLPLGITLWKAPYTETPESPTLHGGNPP